MLRYVDILLVVQLGVAGVQYGVDHTRFQVQQNSSGDVVLIISLGTKGNLVVNMKLIQATIDFFFIHVASTRESFEIQKCS